MGGSTQTKSLYWNTCINTIQCWKTNSEEIPAFYDVAFTFHVFTEKTLSTYYFRLFELDCKSRKLKSGRDGPKDKG